MPTNYLYRRIIFVENSKILSMNQAAKQWDPDVGGEETFGDVRLSASGEEPSTHSACNTRATFQMKSQIDGFDNRPQVSVYVGAGDIENVQKYTWQEALDDMGLQIIFSDII